MTLKRTLKQIEASRLHASDATHIMLYGGSRSGKTAISIRNIILRALKCKSRHAVLRLRFNHVKTSIWHDTLPKILTLGFPDVNVKWNKTDYFIKFDNGSEIWFGGLDDSVRVEKILGNEYSTIYLNECSQISWTSVQVVLTRLAEKTILRNKMYYDCNPPSMGHWTYRVFIKKIDPVSKKPLSDPDDYASIVMNPRDNLVNISEGYLKTLASLSERERKRFELGEFMNDTEGALWTYDMLVTAHSNNRYVDNFTAIAVDPAVTSNINSDETGIIVGSSDGHGLNVIKDASVRASPDTWAQIVVNLYDEFKANFIVVETNQGGDLITSLLNTVRKGLPIKKVHAKKAKFARAEPVVALYEQGKVWHNKELMELENQMLEYVPQSAKESPDRLDALVYAATALIIDNKNTASECWSF